MAIEGQGAQGIYADISGSSVIVNNLEGTVTGRTSGGAATGLSSDGGDILAQGNINLNVAADDEAFGIVSNEGNISLTGSSAQMQVTAANTTGLLTGGGGSHITADNLMMSVTGATFAVAIRNSTSVAGMSSIVVNNSHFSSNKDGVIVDSGTLNLIMNNSTMSNGSGMAFIINDSVGHQSYLNLIASNSHFSGAAVTGAASLLDLDLRSGSTWLVTGDSNLTNLVNDNSHITFAGGAFKTLTVQNYTGNNGYMTMNAHLAGDGSASDKLVIDGGSATGHTFLNIVNAGGMGAMTMGDGILVVETVNGSTIAANAFTLGGRVAAGAYEYTLHRGGSASSENWYLRNSFVDASGQVVPKYRTEVPLAYSIMPAMSDYGLLMAGTLHERVGESRNVLAKTQAAVAPEIVCFKSSMQCIETKGTEQGAVNEGFFHGGWGRVIGRHGEQSGENFQKTGSRYDYDFGAIQAGIDLYGKEDEAGNWDKFGAYFGYGRAKSNVKGVYQGKAGHVDTDMYSLGAYYTHMAASGWYTDTVLQASWYKNDVSSIDGQKLDPDGFGLLASVEAGYAFRFGNGLSLEPQAQIVYQRISLDDVSDVMAGLALKIRIHYVHVSAFVS